MKAAGQEQAPDLMDRVTETDIGSIKPYEKNPRNNKKSIDKVANSIREFGFRIPIVAKSDGSV